MATKDPQIVKYLLDAQSLQQKADQWDRRYRLVLDQNNGAIGRQRGIKNTGDYFQNMSDSESQQYRDWLHNGGLAAYPNQEERERAWLMYRKGSIDVRMHGTKISDKEYKRHLHEAGIENPYRKQLNALKDKMSAQAGPNAVPSQTDLRKAYRNQKSVQQMATGGSPTSKDDPLQKLYDEYKTKIDEANERNEERYKELEQQYKDRHRRGVEGVRGWEEAELLKNAENYEETRGNIGAKYESNLTIGDAFRARADRDERMAAAGIRSDANQRATLLDMQLDKDLADFRERREDVAPDIGVMLQLAQAIGRGNDGKGYSDEPAGETPVAPGSGGSAGATGSQVQQAAQNYRPPTYASGAPIFTNPYAQTVGNYLGTPRSRPQMVYNQPPPQTATPKGWNWQTVWRKDRQNQRRQNAEARQAAKQTQAIERQGMREHDELWGD